MYDPFSQGLIENLPSLDGLSTEIAQRVLSRVYLAIVGLRLSGTQAVAEITDDDALFLRRLANTLESRAIFDISWSEIPSLEQQASAFVSAEALALLARLRETIGPITAEGIARLDREEVFSRVESSLLYIVAGYDANAGGVIRSIPETKPFIAGSDTDQALYDVSEWTLDNLVALCKFYLNPLPALEYPGEFPNVSPDSMSKLQYDVRGRLIARLGESVRSYMAWLTGDEPEGLGQARLTLLWLAERLAGTTNTLNADIHHLARILLVVLDATENRALVQAVPSPDPYDDGKYLDYLFARAKGPVGGSGRPLLWPSVQEYVSQCLPGPHQHAVVSMPTGSGKSFLAELAVSQVLQTGWVLYLVPTNALAHQVRDDLRRDLAQLGADVRAFIGDSEYTTLEGEQVRYILPGTVAVMTPEKCSVAMRIFPSVFETCSLCVFDECHLFNDRSRGVIAEITVSQLMATANNIRFLFMSAMVQNPEDLADWLHEATGEDGLPVTLKWRPTRSLRCVVGVEHKRMMQNAEIAKERLLGRSAHFKNQEFETEFAIIAGLRGAWQSDDVMDYAFTRLPAKSLLKLRREPTDDQDGRWSWSIKDVSWVNESSRRLAQMLADADIQSLVFLPRSRHYPFVVGRKVDLSPELTDGLDEITDIIRAFLDLAQDELGLESEVATLISRGVAVHTSAMLDTEKLASEGAFRLGVTPIMLATGTLAQGLNLPAVAVVIGGTQVGYVRGEPRQQSKRRRLSQLLNAAGRGGRAGFANQGIVIAVPDNPLEITSVSEAAMARDQVSFLQQPDASSEVNSPLENFIDRVMTGSFDLDLADRNDHLAISMLAGGGHGLPTADETIERSYARYLLIKEGRDVSPIGVAAQLSEIKRQFVLLSNSPDWLPEVAQKAGLSFRTTQGLVQSLYRSIPELTANELDMGMTPWFDAFLETMLLLAPLYVKDFFGDVLLSRFELPQNLSEFEHAYMSVDDWAPSLEWVRGWEQVKTCVTIWMNGGRYRDMAAVLLNIEAGAVSSDRNQGSKPIPKTIAFVSSYIDRLALLAGGVVAIIEKRIEEQQPVDDMRISVVPYALSALPLAIRYGCGSPQVLAWYRFGIRLRRPALLLERAFPLDPSIQEDRIMHEMVRGTLHDWLSGSLSLPPDLVESHGSVYESIRVFFQTGG